MTAAAAGTVGYLPSALFVGGSFLDGMIRSGLQAAFVAIARVRWKPDLKLSVVARDLPDGVRWCIIQIH